MQQDRFSGFPDTRARIGWWIFIAILGATAVFLTYSFIGMAVLGVFGYYATRPIYSRLDQHIDYDGIAAGITILLIIIPIILLILYASFQVFQQIQMSLGSDGTRLIRQYLDLGPLSNEQRQILTVLNDNPQKLLTNPKQTLQTVLQMGLRLFSAIIGALLLVVLAVTLSYFLLEHQEELSNGLVSLFGGRDTTAYAYALAVDEDLESVFFGNLLFVIAMSIIAAVSYWGTNFFAPQGLKIPMLLVLAFLTGVASLIPIVVGKVIYLPVVAYLGFQALRMGGNQLLFVGGVLTLYFLVLDILPQTILQPYITGHNIDMVMMMFAYLLGPLLFGWYGFIFLPIVFVMILEAIRIILPELIHGEMLTPDVSIGDGIGTDPQAVYDEDLSERDD